MYKLKKVRALLSKKTEMESTLKSQEKILELCKVGGVDTTVNANGMDLPINTDCVIKSLKAKIDHDKLEIARLDTLTQAYSDSFDMSFLDFSKLYDARDKLSQEYDKLSEMVNSAVSDLADAIPTLNLSDGVQYLSVAASKWCINAAALRRQKFIKSEMDRIDTQLSPINSRLGEIQDFKETPFVMPEPDDALKQAIPEIGELESMKSETKAPMTSVVRKYLN